MSLPRILFIPDQFADYRMWSDVPDRIAARAEAVHLDEVPWAEPSSAILEAAGRLGGCDVVAAAGAGARFGFAITEAGLARGLVLFQPAMNSVPPDVEIDASDLEARLEAMMPFVTLVHDPDPDPAYVRTTFVQAIREHLPPDLPPDQRDLALAMHGEHAAEVFADLQATAAAMAAGGGSAPDPPWVLRPYFDRLDVLTGPVMAVVSAAGRGVGEAIARRARDAEVVVTRGDPGLATPAGRAETAQILLRMLDRVAASG